MMEHLSWREKRGVQAKIKEKYNNARFVHCYTHQLSLFIRKQVKQNIEVETTIGIIDSVIYFFANSPKKINFLEEFIANKTPKLCRTRWNYNSRTIKCVFKNFESLMECLSAILLKENFNERDKNKVIGIISNINTVVRFHENISILNAFFILINSLFETFQMESFNINN